MNKQAHRHAVAGETSTDRQSIDPVCGMRVDANTPYRHSFEGREVHFCSERCRERFIAAPTQYINKADTQPSQATTPATHDHSHDVTGSEVSGIRERVGAPPAEAHSDAGGGPGTIYTCPMHPQIRRPGPATVRTAAWRSSPRCRRWTRKKPRARRLPPALLVDAAADRHRRRARDGRSPLHAVRAERQVVDRARAGDAGRAVGGLAVLRALRRVDPQPQSQHVDADRHRRRGGVSLQRGRRPSRPGCSRSVPRHGPRRRLLRGGGGHRLADAARADARAARALADLGGDQVAARLAPKTARRIRADGTEEDVPLTDVHVGDRCACARARRCRSTAS